LEAHEKRPLTVDSANSFLLQPFVNYNLVEGIDLALHQSGLCRKALMSAYGYKRTCGGVSRRVRFTRESRHSEVQERLGLKKRTLDVRFAPKSGRYG